jgi:hypothetical protein
MINNMLLTAYAWLQSKSYDVAEEEGQGTIEYILVLGVIVAIGAADYVVPLDRIGGALLDLLANQDDGEIALRR